MHAPGGVVRVCMSAAQLVSHTRPGECVCVWGGEYTRHKKKTQKRNAHSSTSMHAPAQTNRVRAPFVTSDGPDTMHFHRVELLGSAALNGW